MEANVNGTKIILNKCNENNAYQIWHWKTKRF